MKAAEEIKNVASKDDVKNITVESKDGVKNATMGLKFEENLKLE